MNAPDPDLQGIRDSLLRGLRVELGPEDGDVAFERHILLAVRFHRAAGLNQTVTGEGLGWQQYFDEYFPKRPEWVPEDETRLWTDWRVGLVKWETPKRGVTVTHGQPEAHWYREPAGTLCVNLESMWDDFEESVESFVDLLERDDARRAEAVGRWHQRSWTVRRLEITPMRLTHARLDVGAAHSATAMGPPDAPRPPNVRP